MPFTEINKPLLLEAASIDFKFGKDGRINYRKHSKIELGLYFIQQAIEKNGNKYGYNKVTYVNNSTKVTLQCKEHGDFEQIPNSHLRGVGCPHCGGNIKHSKDSFIHRALEVHGDSYIYDNINYVNFKTKINITCPMHGDFAQTPNNHLSGKGCPKCKIDTLRSSTTEFIRKAILVHGDRYNYDRVEYLNNTTKITIICKVHGEFSQLPINHLQGGANCPKCVLAAQTLTTENFIEKAQKIHGDHYNYNKVEYVNGINNVIITCKTHGDFEQKAASHLSGSGCPKCVGKDYSILYLLKCLDTAWYKIGITGNLVNRIQQMGGNIEEVHHVVLDDPKTHESILHKKYKREREYNPCVRNGNTEFFSLTEEQVQEVIAYMDEVSNER